MQAEIRRKIERHGLHEMHMHHESTRRQRLRDSQDAAEEQAQRRIAELAKAEAAAAAESKRESELHRLIRVASTRTLGAAERTLGAAERTLEHRYAAAGPADSARGAVARRREEGGEARASRAAGRESSVVVAFV